MDNHGVAEFYLVSQKLYGKFHTWTFAEQISADAHLLQLDKNNDATIKMESWDVRMFGENPIIVGIDGRRRGRASVPYDHADGSHYTLWMPIGVPIGLQPLPIQLTPTVVTPPSEIWLLARTVLINLHQRYVFRLDLRRPDAKEVTNGPEHNFFALERLTPPPKKRRRKSGKSAKITGAESDSTSQSGAPSSTESEAELF